MAISGDRSISRRTLRLTLRATAAGVELLSMRRVEITTPPEVGVLPIPGVDIGHWVELRDAKGGVLAHRTINPNTLGSVEVHGPDGKIERRFGAVEDVVFQVLLPDMAAAETAALCGESLERLAKGPAPFRPGEKTDSGDIAVFKLPRRDTPPADDPIGGVPQ